MNISLQQLEEAVVLRRKIDILEKRFGLLIGTISPSTPKTRRQMTPAARAKIAAAQRARWARVKSRQATLKPIKEMGGLTPAGRRRLSQLMKARWAERRKATAKK